MILINLLPPELRKRKSDFHFNPILGGAVAGGVVCLLMLGAFLWLRGELERSTLLLAQRDTELIAETARALIVTENKAKIAEYVARRDRLFQLLAQKVYWAKTIDDFSKQIAGEVAGGWSQPGFKVSAGDLTVSQIPSEKRAGSETEVRLSFRWRYKIVGDENQKSGDYINSFFKTLEKSAFWTQHGFAGKPDDRYEGDRPRPNDKIKKVMVEGALDWQRVKLVDIKSMGVKSPQGK